MTIITAVDEQDSTSIARDDKRRKRLLLSGLAVSQMVGWGTTFYPIAIIGAAVERDLHISRELAYSGLTIMLAVSATIAPKIGRTLDRNGARAIMIGGSLLSAAGLALLALSHNLIVYLAGWAILGLMMPMALTLSAFTAVTQVMGQESRRAMTLMTFFTGLSSTVFWPLIEVLQTMMGWRAMIGVFAGMHLVLCLPLHALVLPSAAAHRRRLTLAGNDEHKHGVLTADKRLIALVLTAAATSLHGTVGWGLALHFIEMFKSLGLAAGLAVSIASLNGIMQVSARMTDFFFGSQKTPLQLGIVAASLQPMAFIPILFFGATPLTAIFFIFAYGISAGLMTIARATLPLYLFGRDVYGQYAGKLTLPQNLIFGVAPVLFAFVLERSGAISALWFALAASIGSVIAIVSLSRFVQAKGKA